MILASITKGKRETLQDASYYGVYPDGRYVIVCDGMGGMNGGEVASSAVVKLLEGSTDPLLTLMTESTSAVRNAFSAAEIRSGGTTATCATVDNTGLVSWAHVGDSALWFLTKEANGAWVISRLTNDHSQYGALKAIGVASPWRGYKSILVACVDDRASATGQWHEGSVVPPESAQEAWLIATTDGFHDAFDDGTGEIDMTAMAKALADVVADAGDPIELTLHATVNDAAETVNDAAEKTGDNATLVMWRLK